MAITRIKVSNFKSFDELEVDLRPLNVVVGGNASGKSNFLEIFRFVRDFLVHGLENAVSLQGGMAYLANFQIGAARPMSLEITADLPDILATATRAKETIFKLSLQGSSKGAGYETLCATVTAGEYPFIIPSPLPPIAVSLFDFDPKLPKRGTPMTGRADLEPDGSNLALVLKNLFQDDEKRASFIRLLRHLLPFVEDLRVESFLDRSLLLSLREKFGVQHFIPASFLSDGTLQMAAIIVALYFDKAAVMVLEEPDRNIHPHVIAGLAEMMRDASARKQVIATTHNPELVKHTDLEDLLLVHRAKDGFSRIYRPAESKELRIFLDNDLGVEDVYVQNLLAIGHGL